MTAMADRFPEPVRVDPPGPRSASEEWRAARQKYEDFVLASRRRMVAVAVDELRAKAERNEDLSASERISLAVGLSFLDEVGLRQGPFGMGGLF